jgi:hypothetical protein
MVKLLTTLPGARQLTGADMTAVLLQASQTEGCSIEVLLTLPAKSDVCWQSVADLLELAAAAGPCSSTLKALLQLPRAADIDAAMQQWLMQVAISNHDDEVLEQLLFLADFTIGLTARVQAGDVLQLMLAALDAENCRAIMQLCELRAAAYLSPEQLQLLISEIVSRRIIDGDELVCQLCGHLKEIAEQLQPNQVLDLMTEAVEMGCSGETRLLASGMFEALCELPGAKSTQPEQATSLLKRALAATSNQAFMTAQELCGMKAAQHVYTDELAPLVHLAVTRRSHQAAIYMLRLPCAAALAPEHIVRCVHVLLWQLRSDETPPQST